jgi:uncharacterized protein YdaU (DUF1376 family)
MQASDGTDGVNYYEHHLGDYARDAGHLTMLREGAYRRLIDVYYAREKPLPVDLKAILELARCRSRPERCAIESVLKEFFELREDGWHQKRCDEVIQQYLEGEPEREAKRINDKERKRRSRERRAQLFEELREHGVIPKWDSTIGELERALSKLNGHAPVTRDSRDRSQAGHSDQSQPVTRDIAVTVTDRSRPWTASQSPSPNPHLPIPNTHIPNQNRRVCFEVAQGAYPPTAGRADWITAERNFYQRMTEGTDPNALIEGVKRYAAYCNGGGVTSSKFVLSPARFFGDVDRPWAQAWTLPVKLEPPRPRAKSVAELEAEEAERNAQH